MGALYKGDDEMTMTLAAALAMAQGEMTNPSRNAENPHFRSKYADLAGCRDAVLPVLARHGIALVQAPSTNVQEQTVSLTTTLLHCAERLDCGTLTLPLQGSNLSHALGSALTYMRRYALCAVAGVAAGDDDDGNAGKSVPQTRPEPQRREARPDYNRGMGRPQDQPLRAPVFVSLDAALTEAFGPADKDPTAFARADGLALDVCGVGVVDVMQDQAQARKLLHAVQASK